MIDAENIMIPYLRAKFDGDPIHDRITWLMQKETEMGDMISVQDEKTGEYLVKVGEPIEKTYMIALIEVQGIMFNVKEQIPPLFMVTQQEAQQWCDKHHLHFIHSLWSQMMKFVDEVEDTADKLHWLHTRASRKK